MPTHTESRSRPGTTRCGKFIPRGVPVPTLERGPHSLGEWPVVEVAASGARPSCRKCARRDGSA